MAKVKVLIEGYAKKTKTGWIASSTTTLVQEKDLNIIVDPGINKKLLLKKLKENGLATKNIDLVFLTHYHPDHALLAGIFENAKILDGGTIQGKVLVAGDVFWWMDDEKQELDINKSDPFTQNRKALLKSRQKVLKIADWIIPGHGKMFKNPKK